MDSPILLLAAPSKATASGRTATIGDVNPRIYCVAGPLKDSIFALPGGELSIGRDRSNLLCISDDVLSRRHCLLIRDGGRIRILDLNSHNGTFVNGVQVNERWLQHGDQISIGESVFLLLLDEGEEAPILPSVVFEPGTRANHSTVELRAEDVLYFQPDKILQALPATARLARGLSALLSVSEVVHCVRDARELQARLLALVFDVIPAERGAILLVGPSLEEFSSICTRLRTPGAEPMRVSRKITNEVLQKHKAILSTEVASTSFSSDTNLVASKVSSLLCVPLQVFERIIGCIYLDTTSPAVRFDEDHLQLVNGIARISAVAFDNARRLEWLRNENERLKTEIDVQHSMVGESPSMRRVYQFVARVSPSDATVLLQGESGTGKELVARAIHRNSPRANRAFVAINCAAITETLLESELFGHEKGAFTGATAQKRGKLEAADGGTVFLDEVSELAPALQAKLLRALQEREFERVGGTRPIKVDVRLIAATNADLKEAVKTGAFREDLFYRLNVVALTSPSLRERREDIPVLAEHFVRHYAKKCKLRAKPISPQALACLSNYEWPGNVRELENAIESALVLGCGDEILPEDLPEAVLDRVVSVNLVGSRYHAAVKDLKRQLITKAIEEAGGIYTEAAKLLGVHPNYLHRLIRNLNLKAAVRSAPGERRSA